MFAEEKRRQQAEERKQQEEKHKQEKEDSLLIENLSYISQKENQSGSEKSNIFYMYVLGITILGAAISQLVAVHFQIKSNNPNNFSVSSPALDLVASALLIAAFILSRICFRAYIQAVKSQKKWIIIREKILKDKQVSLDNEQDKDEIPYYVRNIMAWSGSLGLAGGIAILVVTGGFLINVCRLQPVLSDLPYKLILTILALLIGFVCSLLSQKWSLWIIFSAPAGFMRRRISQKLKGKFSDFINHVRDLLSRKDWLKKIFSSAMVVGFGTLIYFYFPSFSQVSQSSISNCKTDDPRLASQVFIITGFCFFLTFIGCFVHFKRHIDRSVGSLRSNSNN